LANPEPERLAPNILSGGQPDLDAIVEAILYLYTESRRLTKELAGRYGLTGPQLAVVKMLEPVGKLSLSELSSQIRARNSTVTGIIDRMEREGLVVRRRSQQDRRVINIELTTKGRELASEIPIEPVQIFRRVLEELSPRDATELRRILNKLARRVRELVGESSDANHGPEDDGRGTKQER
jgi:MarR family transcriptional regulator, organic hydroperoxide resistance regulator